MSEPTRQENVVDVAVPGMRGPALSYRAPKAWPVERLPGRRVQVRLGARVVVGVVCPLDASAGADTAIDPAKLRTIESVFDTESASLDADLLTLCGMIARRYLCDWHDVIQAALPPALLAPPKVVVRWVGPEFEGEWPASVQRNTALTKLARYLAGTGQASLGGLRKRLYRYATESNLASLQEAGLIERHDRLAIDVERAATVEVVQLAATVSIDDLPPHAHAQRRAFRTLEETGGEMSWPGLKAAAEVERPVLRALEKAGAVTLHRQTREVIGLGFDPRPPEREPPPLTDEQRAAVDTVRAAMDAGERRLFLLEGLPGTGKTRVYVEMIAHARAQGKGVLVLVPEISLTPQAVARVRNAVREPVVVLHSALNASERLAAWRALQRGEAMIALGPRSAVFAPVHELGLIVVDEEHEEAYKQQDPAPRYHGRDMAAYRGWIRNAPVVLASATPSLETMYEVNERRLCRRLTLTRRFGADWPEIRVVDRRRERPETPYVGPELSRAIEGRSERGEGMILMITRRGFAPVLQCNDCGETEGCPHCDVPLTFHTVHGKTPLPGAAMRCHLCGYTKRLPDQCRICASTDLRALGMGTQRIEEEIQQRFPALAPIRMDRDTLRRSGQQERILRAFGEGDAQVLLGTQLVAKGHDFGHVTLVGVINADPALNQPDFRASERTFRLLVQAAGRAGRGELPGEVIIQTLRPEHAVFTFLQQPSTDEFIRGELDRRRLLGYPPFAHLTALTFLGTVEARVKASAERFRDELAKHGGPVNVLGPEPAFIRRVKRKYRWRLLLRTDKRVDGNGAILRRTAWRVTNAAPLEAGVRLNVDVDPTEVA
ncbi:MAG: Primosomal protein N' [Calditrichaeota bacterium]|nr:Primosomal protein N' [Calditrichota bacterium]